jgi:hypothetical protein
MTSLQVLRRVIAALCYTACALSPLSQALAAYPVEITAEDRTQFTDELDKYPRKILPDVKWSQTVFGWVDNTHIALSVRETPDGWKAKDGELARIIIIDTDTNAITDSPYRGELMCLTQGKMVVRQPLDGQSMLNHRKDDLFLSGVWGQELKPMEWKNGDFLAQWSCERQPYRTSIRTNLEVQDRKLLPGHGTLRFPSQWSMTGNPKDLPPVEWLDDSGKVINRWSSSSLGVPLVDSLIYLPWLDSYWNSTANGSTMFRPMDNIESQAKPKLLIWWENNNVGGGGARFVKGGALWDFMGKVEYWRRQGLYMQSANGLIRVDDGQWRISKYLHVSPDGCRIVASRLTGDPTRSRKAGRITMMNFCTQEKK